MTVLRVLCLGLLLAALPAGAQKAPAARPPTFVPAAPPAPPASTAPVGEVTLVVGRATAASPDGVFRNLTKGGPVYRGETLSTAPDSYVNIKFADRGLVFLKPGTLFEIREFTYAATAPQAPAPVTPQAQRPAPPVPTSSVPASRVLFGLLRGGLRTVTGLIGKASHGTYQLITPVATIGIRGTDYFAYLCDEKCQADPVLRAELPEGFEPTGSLVSGVEDGTIEIGFKCRMEGSTTPSSNCSATLKKGQFLAVSKDGQASALPRPPQFLQDDPFLDPQACAK